MRTFGRKPNPTPAVPRNVRDVLRSTGEPLDEETRAFMEPRFGHDFSGVRVHTDARAAESARDLDASAYTVGSNIVFGAGQFLPQTDAGQHLLSHELSHVVQQRLSPGPVAHGVGVPGDFHERQAESVADTVMRGGRVAGLLDSGARPVSYSLQRQPAQPQPVPPPRYDRKVYHVAPVAAGQTAANLTRLLNAKVSQRDITRFTTRGGVGNETIFLLSILYSLADRARWNTEADLVIDIDWPPKGGGPAPRGQVTVRIDSNGAATAELVARGVPAATRQTTEAALQTSFKLAAVGVEGSAAWSPAELSDVGEALAMLPAADRAALEGVELIRVVTIPGKPNDGGQFDFPSGAATSPASVNIRPKLRLANSAFDQNAMQFFGGSGKSVPASFQTILHEVGHAVESEVYRSKWGEHAQALADVKAAGDVQESPARVKERQETEARLKTARSAAAKDRLEKKLARFDAELAMRSSDAADQKAIATKLKDKEKVVMDLDAAGPTARLTKFVDLVTRNSIAPFTDYARQGNAEFYAEAYSLWLVDPVFLRTSYRVVFDFFQNGDYRR
jgi:hypothetical protein